MATTPKRSLKRTLASTVEDRSPRFLLGSLALAMVISLVAGLGIGMTVEQHRDRDNSKQAKPAVVKKKQQPKAVKKVFRRAIATNAPPTAIVVRRGPNLLSVIQAERPLSTVLIKGTRVEVATPAARSDIVAGSRVLVVFKAKNAVSEILIVTSTGKGMGSAVTAVTPTTMTLKYGKQSLTVSTMGAKIEKTVLGGRANITKGRRVIVRTFDPAPTNQGTRQIKQLPIAVEVVVLSPRSAFR